MVEGEGTYGVSVSRAVGADREGSAQGRPAFETEWTVFAMLDEIVTLTGGTANTSHFQIRE